MGHLNGSISQPEYSKGIDWQHASCHFHLQLTDKCSRFEDAARFQI